MPAAGVSWNLCWTHPQQEWAWPLLPCPHPRPPPPLPILGGPAEHPATCAHRPPAFNPGHPERREVLGPIWALEPRETKATGVLELGRRPPATLHQRGAGRGPETGTLTALLASSHHLQRTPPPPTLHFPCFWNTQPLADTLTLLRPLPPGGSRAVTPVLTLHRALLRSLEVSRGCGHHRAHGILTSLPVSWALSLLRSRPAPSYRLFTPRGAASLPIRARVGTDHRLT